MREIYRKINTKSPVKKAMAFFILLLFTIYSLSAYGDCSTHGQACESSPISDCHRQEKKLNSTKVSHHHQHSHKHDHALEETSTPKVESTKNKSKANENTKACECENPKLAVIQNQSLEKDTKQNKVSGISSGNWSDLLITSKHRLLRIPISNGRASPIFIFQEKLLI